MEKDLEEMDTKIKKMKRKSWGCFVYQLSLILLFKMQITFFHRLKNHFMVVPMDNWMLENGEQRIHILQF